MHEREKKRGREREKRGRERERKEGEERREEEREKKEQTKICIHCIEYQSFYMQITLSKKALASFIRIEGSDTLLGIP